MEYWILNTEYSLSTETRNRWASDDLLPTSTSTMELVGGNGSATWLQNDPRLNNPWTCILGRRKISEKFSLSLLHTSSQHRRRDSSKKSYRSWSEETMSFPSSFWTKLFLYKYVFLFAVFNQLEILQYLYFFCVFSLFIYLFIFMTSANILYLCFVFLFCFVFVNILSALCTQQN